MRAKVLLESGQRGAAIHDAPNRLSGQWLAGFRLPNSPKDRPRFHARRLKPCGERRGRRSHDRFVGVDGVIRGGLIGL